MNGYDVVTTEEEKVGTIVGEQGNYLIVEHGTLRKSKHALPRELAHVSEGEHEVRITVPKDVFYDSPKLNGELDEQAVAEYYGLASSAVTEEGDPARSSEEQALRDGVMPAAQERAQIREGAMDDAGLPKESPALLGDRVAGTEKDR